MNIVIVILMLVTLALNVYILNLMLLIRDALTEINKDSSAKEARINELQQFAAASEKTVKLLGDRIVKISKDILALKIRTNSAVVDEYFKNTAKGPTRVKYPDGHVYIPEVELVNYSGKSLFEAPDQESAG